MSKFGKLGEILKAAVKVGAVIPSPGQPILAIVSESIADKTDPDNTGALTGLGTRVDDHEKAILALHERLKKLEGR